MSGVRAGRGTRIGPYAARVVTIALLIVAIVVVWLVISASRDTYQVRAVFDDVRGLIPGGDVTAGSIVVGSVTEVFLNEGGDPEVVMEVDGDFELHRGATANIRLASNVGAVNRVVDLAEGDPGQDELGEGATLAGERTDQPVNFDLAVQTLQPKVRKQFKRILVGLDEALLERGPDFDRTLRHSAESLNETANLLGEVNADGEALRTIVSEGRRVVSALASSPRDLGEAAERTATLLRTTAGRQQELAETTELLGPSLAAGTQLLDRTTAAVPSLRELVAEAGPVVDELGPFAEQAVPASRAAGPFVEETRKLVRDTPEQLRLQVPFLRTAPPVVGRLEPTLERLNPIADELRAYTPEIIGFFQNVADAAANYDVNGHMIRVANGLGNFLPPSTGAGGSLGPSECGPGLLEAPYHRTPGVNECDPWEDWRTSLLSGGRGGGG